MIYPYRELTNYKQSSRMLWAGEFAAKLGEFDYSYIMMFLLNILEIQFLNI